MAVEVILPKVDMDMSSAVISRWHVKDGDNVTKGQAIFDIETDKAAMEIEAPGEGTIRLADLAGARDIAIGTIVAMIYGAHEEVKEKPARAAPLVPPAPAPPPAVAVPPLPGDHAMDSGIRATPLARRSARLAGVDLKQVTGSGPRGRIVAADVRASTEPEVTATGNGAAHFCLTATCNADALLALQQRLNTHAPKSADRRPAWQLTITDFLVKALGTALLRSVAWQKPVEISVTTIGAADTQSVLLEKAEGKSLSAIALQRAAGGRVQSNAGGSAAVCDLGGLGVELISGFINMPQAVVLAAGAPVENFIAVAGQPVLAKRICITLICDHRAIDVASGARLLAAIKAIIEEPARLLL